MTAIAEATTTRFHVGLNVSDLARSVRFYQALFGIRPAKHLDDYAKFELEEPPLVLALYPSPQQPGGALNHIGLRLTDSAALVEVQRRLEETGIATQRQEGVECCYARQTKFWVTDPDRTLWEIYTLHEDIEHSGFDDPPPALAVAPEAIWEHRLTEPLPVTIPHASDSLDEVRLEGTWNIPRTADEVSALLAEVRRVLRPGGTISVHGLVSDQPFPGEPKLPGLASLVRYVPVETEPLAALSAAGFTDLVYEKLGDIHCFGVNGVELREMRLSGRKPVSEAATSTSRVLYKGPFAEVVIEDGTVLPRGKVVEVAPSQAAQLRNGPSAASFAFLP